MKHLQIWAIVLLFTCHAADAQKTKNYVRGGIGTAASQGFLESNSLVVEYGKTFAGFEAGIQLSLFNSLPLQDTEARGISIQNPGTDKELLILMSRKPLSGKRDVSLMFNAGYNLLSLIPGNKKHFFIPFVGIGFSDLTKVEYMDGTSGERLSLIYDHKFSHTFMFGCRYEYGITDKTKLGLYYSYYNLVEQDIAGISLCHSF